MAEDRSVGKHALVLVNGTGLTSAISQAIADNPDVMIKLFGVDDVYPSQTIPGREYVHDMRIDYDSYFDLPPPQLPAPRGMKQISPGKFRAADPYSRHKRF